MVGYVVCVDCFVVVYCACIGVYFVTLLVECVVALVC